MTGLSLKSKINLCACHLEININAHRPVEKTGLSQRHCNTGVSETLKLKPYLERMGNFHFMRCIVAYCLSRVDKSNQWPGSTPGQPQWEGEEGMVGVKAHTLENELLSFKTKIPHDGKAAKWHYTVTAPC